MWSLHTFTHLSFRPLFRCIWLSSHWNICAWFRHKRIWVLKDHINPLAVLSDQFVCNAIHFLTSSYLPFPVLRKWLILFSCISLHNRELSPFQLITSPCVSCRNLRLGGIFSHSDCEKAVFWHFTRTASRIQIRTSHLQRKILTLTSTNFFLFFT